MLIPKKVKHRKWQKGKSLGRRIETRGLKVSYGEYGLKALEPVWLTSAQIEAARKAITGAMNRRGRLWIRVFPDKPITKRPPETTMGGGKGSVDHYVARIGPGRILFEIDGVEKPVAFEAMRLASHKLPCKSRVVEKE